MKKVEYEYDFHGMRAHEVERRLTQLLARHSKERDAMLVIIHGKGSGVLAKVVGDVARRHRAVAAVTRGYLNDGITRIELK